MMSNEQMSKNEQNEHEKANEQNYSFEKKNFF